MIEIINKVRNIYSQCSDEVSKQIYMDKILFAMSGDRKYVHKLICETMKEIGTNIKAIKERKKVIIYGAGANLDFTMFLCDREGIKIQYICDKDKLKQKQKYGTIEVISPENLVEQHLDATIIVSTTTYVKEVVEFLDEFYKKDQIICWEKEVLERIKKQYFDSIIKFQKDEIFIDGGCYDFETCKMLLEKCEPYRIYAFEPDKYNLEKVKSEIKLLGLKNVEIINSGLWDCEKTLYFSSKGTIMSRVDENGEDQIHVVSIDERIKDNVTFIKMDIEGSELKALKGAEKTIKKYKPKLAISIYHKLDDIVTIPDFIHSIVPEYKFYLRHYSLCESETVLYAIVE